ncbi:hypothetical protein C8Q77DRAFT_1148098 [Trametes polyzona]|nr:hypothetical protein C8Q77DRAFT_1148098 [Trametes polyzona]
MVPPVSEYGYQQPSDLPSPPMSLSAGLEEIQWHATRAKLLLASILRQHQAPAAARAVSSAPSAHYEHRVSPPHASAVPDDAWTSFHTGLDLGPSVFVEGSSGVQNSQRETIPQYDGQTWMNSVPRHGTDRPVATFSDFDAATIGNPLAFKAEEGEPNLALARWEEPQVSWSSQATTFNGDGWRTVNQKDDLPPSATGEAGLPQLLDAPVYDQPQHQAWVPEVPFANELGLFDPTGSPEPPDERAFVPHTPPYNEQPRSFAMEEAFERRRRWMVVMETQRNELPGMGASGCWLGVWGDDGQVYATVPPTPCLGRCPIHSSSATL